MTRKRKRKRKRRTSSRLLRLVYVYAESCGKVGLHDWGAFGIAIVGAKTK